MPKKFMERGVQSAYSSPNRWGSFGQVLAVGLLIVGALLLFLGHTHASTSGSSKVTMQTKSSSQKVGPLVPESQWGTWHQNDQGQTFPTTQHPFAMGQTITVPSYVSIHVDSIDRNWKPQPWQVSPYPTGYQDDAKGKEVILVRFTIQNLSKVPVTYSDSYFSLVRASGHEQRVADLTELTGDQYGSFGQANPWLEPGATVHTFVPFLVNPGEQPEQFVLSWKITDPTKTPTVSPQSGRETLPSYQNIARIPVAISTPAKQGIVPASLASSVTFTPDATFTVASADVYSTTPPAPGSPAK